MIGSQRLSHNARKSLAKGLLAAGVVGTLYLAVVMLTTPNLPPAAAASAALSANGFVISGMAIAVGAQMFFSTYGKRIGCGLGKKAFAGGSSGAAIGSFLSFFSLVPLGCCGSWLVVLSFLPSIFGGTISVFLIEYSAPLSYASVTTMLALAALSGVRLWRKLKRNVIT